MAKKLIALVATAVMVAGVRTVIQPGEELPELSAHDERELEKSGALQNDAVKEAEKRASDKAEKAGQAEFKAARAAVIAENESIDSATSGADDAAPAKSKAK